MEKQSNQDGRRFIMLPSALLPVLSNTALRIILYAKLRQGLVEIGELEKWELSLENLRDEFGHQYGYRSKNTIRNGIRELKKLKLIIPYSDHYRLNVEEYKKWYYRKGLPNSGKGGLPKSGRAGLPKSGNQQKSSNKQNSITVEGEIAPRQGTISPIPKAPAQAPVNRKLTREDFYKAFPPPAGYVEPPEKTIAEQIDEFIAQAQGAKSPEKEATVSGITGQPPETLSPTNSGEPAQTTPPTDPQRRQND